MIYKICTIKMKEKKELKKQNRRHLPATRKANREPADLFYC